MRFWQLARILEIVRILIAQMPIVRILIALAMATGFSTRRANNDLTRLVMGSTSTNIGFAKIKGQSKLSEDSSIEK